MADRQIRLFVGQSTRLQVSKVRDRGFPFAGLRSLDAACSLHTRAVREVLQVDGGGDVAPLCSVVV